MWFGGANFGERAWFDEARFGKDAWYGEVRFRGTAQFDGASFGGNAHFELADFDGNAWFEGADFGGEAWFNHARFGRAARFGLAKFGGQTFFFGARTRVDDRRGATPKSEWPEGWVEQRPGTEEEGRLADGEGLWGFLHPEWAVDQKELEDQEQRPSGS